MRLTKFIRLRQALSNLDVNLIARRINRLEEILTQKGKIIEPENTAITQEGIYYIEPESGMATKIVLYISDHPMHLEGKPDKASYLTGYTDQPTIARFHPYHIVRCNVLTQAEKEDWKTSYTMLQRNTGSFYYKIIKEPTNPKENPEIYQEIEHQKLYVCSNCLMKVSSIIDGVEGVKREAFPLKVFFDVDFTRSWMTHEKLSKDKGFLENIYPKDWLEICRIRKEQMQYHCEACMTNLSDRYLREFLYVHPTDHVLRKVGYVKLECLCIACLAEHPSRAQLKDLPDYIQYIKYLHRSRQNDAQI
jgi:hypothetical protein